MLSHDLKSITTFPTEWNNFGFYTSQQLLILDFKTKILISSYCKTQLCNLQPIPLN